MGLDGVTPALGIYNGSGSTAPQPPLFLPHLLQLVCALFYDI